jgi:uncharacterized protein
MAMGRQMKIVIPGGSGHLGRLLARELAQSGNEVVVLSRGSGGIRGARESNGLHGSPGGNGRATGSPGCGGTRVVAWDGRTVGAWADDVDGADAVINLAGRTVNCRYTEENLREMLDSRVDSTRAVGRAIERAARPPRVWLQASTATIYAHRFDAPNDESTGRLGGDEPGVPAYWRRSIEIAAAWEAALAEARTPGTRKVALRTAMVMDAQPGGVLDVLVTLARWGLGGAIAGGRQFVSWVHERDFVRAVAFVLGRDDLAGAVNVAAPHPLPQRALMAALRRALGVPVGLPAARWMAEVGAFFLRTDTELVLKSRRVVPTRLLEAGFAFEFPEWPAAARDLVARMCGRTGGNASGVGR